MKYLKNKNTGEIGIFSNNQGEDWIEPTSDEIQEFEKKTKNQKLKAEYIAERDKKSYENIVVDGVEYIADKEAQDNYLRAGAISLLRKSTTSPVMTAKGDIVDIPLATLKKIACALYDRQVSLWKEYETKIKALENS
jgi:hypothetical protein